MYEKGTNLFDWNIPIHVYLSNNYLSFIIICDSYLISTWAYNCNKIFVSWFSDQLEDILALETLQNIRIFKGCDIFEEDLEKIASNCKKLNRICLSDYYKQPDTPLEFEFVEMKRIVNSNKTSLKHICFNMCAISDYFFDYLIEINGFQLRSFHMRYCRNINFLGFGRFCKVQKELTEIDLSFSEIRNEDLLVVSKNLPHLQILKIRSCDGITDVSIYLWYFFLNPVIIVS